MLNCQHYRFEWLLCGFSVSLISYFLYVACAFLTNVSPAGFYRLSVENFFRYVTAAWEDVLRVTGTSAREDVLPVTGASARDASSQSRLPLHGKASSRSQVPPSGFLLAPPRRSPLLAWGFVNHDNWIHPHLFWVRHRFCSQLFHLS